MITVIGYDYRHTEKADMTIDHFPDGTPHITCEKIKGVRRYRIDWRYENDEELFQVMCLKDKIDTFSPSSVSLYLPYIPNARMDRVKDSWDVFTLKTFCNVVNSMKFDKVIVLDPHSNVSTALLDRVVVIQPKSCIEWAIEMLRRSQIGNLLLFYPDEGAMKRYSGLINREYTFGIKRRNWTTGVITDLEIENKEIVNGRDVLIVDDICSRGGTFYHSAKKLKALGANRIFLYVTHCEKTVISGDMYNEDELITAIFTTSSIHNNMIDPLNKIITMKCPDALKEENK